MQQTTDLGLRGLPLLKYILDGIESGELNHRQDKWGYAPMDDERQPELCNSAYCVAGWAAKLTGASFQFYRSTEGDYYFATLVHTPDGQYEKVSDYARQVLQLTDDDADVLFWWHNSYEQLRMFEKLLDEGISLKEYVND